MLSGWYQWKRLESKILAAGSPREGIHIFYGHRELPRPGEISHGGIIKFQRLNEFFPNSPGHFNLLYMVSSNYPRIASRIAAAAHRKGVKLVWNQDGVAYPAWKSQGWEAQNEEMAELLHRADYVFYQSKFSRLSSDKYLGERAGPAEILYNAVDTTTFSPGTDRKENVEVAPVLLTAGSKDFFHRVEIPIQTLSLVRGEYPRARLVMAGSVRHELVEPMNQLISELGLEGAVEMLPPFTQREAPDIFRSGHIFVHPKLNDPCPGIVIEAMACGLPVVYSNSGGTPELVGPMGGVGIPTELRWDAYVPPDRNKWASAVLKVIERYSTHSEAARQRAVERFDLKPWVERHRQVFTQILETP